MAMGRAAHLASTETKGDGVEVGTRYEFESPRRRTTSKLNPPGAWKSVYKT